jgi:hypothetical protein
VLLINSKHHSETNLLPLILIYFPIITFTFTTLYFFSLPSTIVDKKLAEGRRYTMDRCNLANTISSFLLSVKTYCESLKMKLAILEAQRVILVFSIFSSIVYTKNKANQKQIMTRYITSLILYQVYYQLMKLGNMDVYS